MPRSSATRDRYVATSSRTPLVEHDVELVGGLPVVVDVAAVGKVEDPVGRVVHTQCEGDPPVERSSACNSSCWARMYASFLPVLPRQYVGQVAEPLRPEGPRLPPPRARSRMFAAGGPGAWWPLGLWRSGDMRLEAGIQVGAFVLDPRAIVRPRTSSSAKGSNAAPEAGGGQAPWKGSPLGAYTATRLTHAPSRGRGGWMPLPSPFRQGPI